MPKYRVSGWMTGEIYCPEVVVEADCEDGAYTAFNKEVCVDCALSKIGCTFKSRDGDYSVEMIEEDDGQAPTADSTGDSIETGSGGEVRET